MKKMTLLVVALLLAACGESGNQISDNGRSLEAIKESGELRVVSRNAPTVYYIDRDNHAAGPEYQMIKAFAESLGVGVRIVVAETIGDVLNTLESGKADVAASGLTVTEQRKTKFLFSSPTDVVTEQLVCRRGGNVAKRIDQLPRISIEIPANSSYEETLTTLQQENPAITWKANAEIGTEPLLQKVWEGKLDCTVGDSNIVAVNRRFMPELIVMLDLSEQKNLAWAFPKGAEELVEASSRWLASEQGRSVAQIVHDRYYSYIETFDFVDTRALIKRMDERLPKYEDLFEKAANKHGIDPSLLAAQAYQESHWDAQAKSPTGVRGIMMLTQNTATSLGVKDRLDPKEAIPAGADYLYQMREKFDESIGEPDRTYMALAAYNVGRAHMHDAQTLARRLGKDPYSWADMREVLPLLSDKRYYKDLKYGYARGLEPVRYVQRIRNYEDIIDEK